MTKESRLGLGAKGRAQDEAALESRSGRPKTSPGALSAEVVELVVRIRKALADAGLDAGPVAIAWHLQDHHNHRFAMSTIAWLDDCTRYALHVTDHSRSPFRSWARPPAQARPTGTSSPDVFSSVMGVTILPTTVETGDLTPA